MVKRILITLSLVLSGCNSTPEFSEQQYLAASTNYFLLTGCHEKNFIDFETANTVYVAVKNVMFSFYVDETKFFENLNKVKSRHSINLENCTSLTEALPQIVATGNYYADQRASQAAAWQAFSDSMDKFHRDSQQNTIWCVTEGNMTMCN